MWRHSQPRARETDGAARPTLLRHRHDHDQNGERPMPAPAVAEGDSQLIETARRVLPGGGFGNVSHEIIVAEGKGGRVWDVNGKEYVDYLLGSGPMIVGHAHPEVV